MSQMPGTQDVAVHLNPAAVTTYFTGMQQRDVSFLEVRSDQVASGDRTRIWQRDGACLRAFHGSMLCCAVSWRKQQLMHASGHYARQPWVNVTVKLRQQTTTGLGQPANYCFGCSCRALQNINACKESVLEAAALYADEKDDAKVRRLLGCF